MTDKVTIVNMALGHLRAEGINDFEEISVAAGYARTYYDIARQSTLEKHDYSFARKRKALTLLSSESLPDVWSYKYAMPAACLKLRYIASSFSSRPNPAIPFTTELNDAGTAKILLANEADAIGVFTLDIENTAIFTPGYTLATSWMLAGLLAVPITGRREDRDSCMKMWQWLCDQAESDDANEVQEDQEPDGEFVQSRR